MNYEIRIDWDDEAKVWYVAESNVPGLVGEAPTLEAMMALLRARVPEMLEENGCPSGDDIPLRLLAKGHLGQMRTTG
jgi:hypothetical protein